MPTQKRDDGITETVIRRYAAGKCLAFAAGDSRYAKEAKAALRSATSLQTVFSPQQFLATMRNHGVPDNIAAAYVETAKAIDETHFTDTDGSYFKDVDP